MKPIPENQDSGHKIQAAGGTNWEAIFLRKLRPSSRQELQSYHSVACRQADKMAEKTGGRRRSSVLPKTRPGAGNTIRLARRTRNCVGRISGCRKNCASRDYHGRSMSPTSSTPSASSANLHNTLPCPTLSGSSYQPSTRKRLLKLLSC